MSVNLFKKEFPLWAVALVVFFIFGVLAIGNLDDGFLTVVGFAICGALIWLYFLPTITAIKRHLKNSGSVLCINLFLGWTLVGWVIAMSWAVSGTAEQYENTEAIVPKEADPQPKAPKPDIRKIEPRAKKTLKWLIALPVLFAVALIVLGYATSPDQPSADQSLSKSDLTAKAEVPVQSPSQKAENLNPAVVQRAPTLGSFVYQNMSQDMSAAQLRNDFGVCVTHSLAGGDKGDSTLDKCGDIGVALCNKEGVTTSAATTKSSVTGKVIFDNVQCRDRLDFLYNSARALYETEFNNYTASENGGAQYHPIFFDIRAVAWDWNQPEEKCSAQGGCQLSKRSP